jgi:hypothetical protein
MTKIFLITLCGVSFVFCEGNVYQNTPSVTSSQSRMHSMQQKHPDRLASDQRHVYYMLSPLYQRIFLYGLDDEQREMVTVFEKRGENPYQAIDNLMRRDRKIADRSYQRDFSPLQRSQRENNGSRYSISQRKKEQNEQNQQMIMDTDQEEEEEFEQQSPPITCAPVKYKDREVSSCNSCTKRCVKKESAFVKRCKSYFSKCKTQEPPKQNNCMENSNRKKYQYEEPLSKRRNCKCRR